MSGIYISGGMQVRGMPRVLALAAGKILNFGLIGWADDANHM